MIITDFASGTSELKIHNVSDSGKYRPYCSINPTKIINGVIYYEPYTITAGGTEYKFSSLEYSISVPSTSYIYKITPLTLELEKEINKQYDGTSVCKNYKIQSSDVASTYSELAGATVDLQYTGSAVNSTITTAEFATSNTNYKVTATGKIVARNVELDIGTSNQITYNASKNYAEITLTNKSISGGLTIKTITIITSGKNAGVYSNNISGAIGTVSVSSLSVTFTSTSTSIDNDTLTNYSFTINGSIEITQASFPTAELQIGNTTTTYNGSSQNITVKFLGETLQINSGICTLKNTATNKVFNGATNAGTYNLSLTISHSNYATYNTQVTFVINVYEVFVNVTSSISKTYDGTADVINPWYTLYTTGNVAANTERTAEIEGHWKLVYDSPNWDRGAQKPIQILLDDAEILNNYSISLKTAKTGTISRKNMTIPLSIQYVYTGSTPSVSTDSYAALADSIQSKLVSTQTLKSANMAVDTIKNVGKYEIGARGVFSSSTNYYSINYKIGNTESTMKITLTINVE
ncbi:MAG: hypothetical protein IJW25_02000, partial [Clostridia bacterium]|nr:hypothetical protein [Clostridia bacterium]